jgi:hypothetical protein
MDPVPVTRPSSGHTGSSPNNQPQTALPSQTQASTISRVSPVGAADIRVARPVSSPGGTERDRRAVPGRPAGGEDGLPPGIGLPLSAGVMLASSGSSSGRPPYSCRLGIMPDLA